MGSRHRARELAVQVLYGLDLNPGSVDQAISGNRHWVSMTDSDRDFARDLVEGTAGRLPELDSLILAASHKWDLKRMAVVDRNVLRIAVYELTQHGLTPARVVINEAIELAKDFGGEESGVFVNGLLDQIRINIGREIE